MGGRQTWPLDPVRPLRSDTNHMGGLLLGARVVSLSLTLARPAARRGISMSERTEIDRSSQCITIRHDSSVRPAPEASVIVLHGLGDTAFGWSDVAGMWAASMPTVRFVLPTAPIRPVTLNGGMQMTAWYDITTLDDKEEDDCAGVDESRTRIDAMIQSEADKVGGASRVLLAGFSQGGALALYTGFQREAPLAGVLCLSGYLPKPATFQVHAASLGTHVMFCHGDSDMVVRWAFGNKSAAHLQKLGISNMEFKTYEDMGHSACAQEISDAADFIAGRLGVGQRARGG